MLHKSKLTLALMTIAILILVVATGNIAEAQTTELFISEYIEGGSLNKAIEIYNGTGGAVDLTAGLYSLELYSNGSATASQTVALTGTVADGDVYVVAHASAAAAVLDETDLISSAVANFNGDDAVVLRKNGAVVDAFGQIGVDPGSEWPGGGANDTLRRNDDICAGDTDASDAFDASAEWTTFAQDTFDGLGSHTAICSSSGATELFMSEYIEGGSLNKAIEIYNGTGGAVDLTAGLYSLELYSNGSATASQTVALTGTVADGDVYVVAHASAATAVLDETDLISSAVANFNGDDAVVLRKNGAVVDAFGQIGVDPGSEWPGGGANDTLRRNDDICAGDTDASDAFDASAEWTTFAQDTFDGLGSHTAVCGGGGGGPSDPLINEFVFNHTGSDTEAFIEVLAAPSTDLSAFTILEIEGDASSSGDTVSIGVIDAVLPVGTTDSGGYWTDDEDVENGTVTLLLVEGFSGSLNDDLDIDGDGVLESTPWTRIVDDVAVTDGGSLDQTYAGTVLDAAFDGGVFTVGGASRIPNGTDTDALVDWVRNDFDGYGFPGFVGTQQIGEAVNTPGTVNEVITVIVDPFGACDEPATLIHNIQGSGLVSPEDGNIRAVEAVVVAVFQDPDQIGGYFIQEEDTDADADPLTSEGLRIFDPVNTPNVGDVIRIRGSVTEYFSLTEINNVTDFTVCGTGVATAAPVSLPVNATDDLEAYEGMLVTFPQELVIAEYFNFDRFGEIVLTSDRRLTPTAQFEPGPDAIQAAQDYLLSKITIDDARGGQNPDPAYHPNGGIFDLTNLFRGGDTVANVTGVLDYNFGAYKVQPTQGADYTSTNPRTAAPDDVGGDLKVAAFNVLNYFTTLDYPSGNPLDNMCGPLANQECRGADADQPNEFTRQRDKIISALTVIDADVVGLIEIENHPADIPTADLVNGLNLALGAGTYDYVTTGAIGTDAIRVALIYKPASVSTVGGFEVLDSTEDPSFNDQKNRPVLAQTFMDSSTGGVFTVAVNHLKSKGSSCDDVGDPDTGDGSGNCNLTRLAAAQALVDWLAADPTGSGDEDFLIIGDLNSYDKEEPIDAIVASGYTDLIHSYLGEDAYSYVFDGQVGYLDYALANAGLVDQVTGTTVWHINADEADLIDYDTSFKQDAQDAIYAPDAYRASDHDPVIVGLALDSPEKLKTDAIGLLASLLPTGDRSQDHRINKAIVRIDYSLNPLWWESKTTLDDKKGKHVFTHERIAVVELMKVVKKGGTYISDVQNAIDLLVEADRKLAQKELDAAIADGGNARQIARAQRYMDKAAKYVARGNFDKAIGEYKKAWQTAVRAH